MPPLSIPHSDRRNHRWAFIVSAAAVVVIALIVVGAVGLTRDTTTSVGGSRNTTRSEIATETTTFTPVVQSTVGFTLSDPAGDAEPHAYQGEVYGPSDIVSVSVHSEDTNLVIAIDFTPSTPMESVHAGIGMRLNPDAVPTCNDSVLDSFDWAIGYDPSRGVEVYQPGAQCDDPADPTSIAGAAEITGSTLTIKIAQDSLGVRPGQLIVVRAYASTAIDANSSTFIHDYAPDSANGTVGTV